MSRFSCTFFVCVFLSASLSSVQTPASQGERVAEAFDPSRVEVLVLGAPHLWQSPARIGEEGLVRIRERLAAFAADHVVVEWLHPSIDPAATDNYEELGDPTTLARLWAVALDELPALRAEAERGLRERPDDASLRVRLGKLFYCQGDALNAGYQWWRAARLGSDTSELGNLTDENFAGHELEVFGFALAELAGLEYITPFDYQGEDAGWGNVFGELMTRATRIALGSALGLEPGEAGFEEEAQAFQELLYTDLDACRARYAKDRRVSALIGMIERQAALQASFEEQAANDPNGMFGFLQSPESIEQQRKLYYDDLWNMPFSGLGRQLVVNYERRNMKMVDFLEEDVRRSGARRVLVVVGGGHKLFLESLLTERGYALANAADWVAGSGG